MVKKSGQVIGTTFKPRSISIHKSGTNFPTERTDVFISKDGKNINQLYYEWGCGNDSGQLIKNYVTGEYYHSSRPNNITSLAPKPWTSIGNIYR